MSNQVGAYVCSAAKAAVRIQHDPGRVRDHRLRVERSLGAKPLRQVSSCQIVTGRPCSVWRSNVKVGKCGKSQEISRDFHLDSGSPCSPYICKNSDVQEKCPELLALGGWPTLKWTGS